MVWRAGQVRDLALKLAVMGTYSDTRIPVLLDYLKSYGKAAREAIPDIKALIAIVQNGEMPSHPVNKKKIAQCEAAIKAIEAATDHPELLSAGSTPTMAKDPRK